MSMNMKVSTDMGRQQGGELADAFLYSNAAFPVSNLVRPRTTENSVSSYCRWVVTWKGQNNLIRPLRYKIYIKS
jgi:hypothetical protein